MVHFHEIQKKGHVTEVNLDVIVFNPIVSTILKWRKFKILRWLHRSARDYQRLSLVNMASVTVEAVLVQQWAPELNPFLTTVTIVGDIIMGTKVHCLA
jgi:hypothetical protein